MSCPTIRVGQLIQALPSGTFQPGWSSFRQYSLRDQVVEANRAHARSADADNRRASPMPRVHQHLAASETGDEVGNHPPPACAVVVPSTPSICSSILLPKKVNYPEWAVNHPPYRDQTQAKSNRRELVLLERQTCRHTPAHLQTLHGTTAHPY